MFATIVGTVHLGLIVDPDFCSDDLVPSNEQPSNIKKRHICRQQTSLSMLLYILNGNTWAK